MEEFNRVLIGLERFSRKYYTKMLIQGLLMFITLVSLLLFLLLGVEYFLWLPSFGRMLLLVLGVLVLIFLLYRFILIPISFLFKIRRVISNKDASDLIGIHFPEIGDRLRNLLDLSESDIDSELLLASINQRANQLKSIPFWKAIDLREGLAGFKYLFIPLIIYLLVWFTGNLGSFFSSYQRVVNYDLAYEPPAPFRFVLQHPDLTVLANSSFEIVVSTIGELQPEEVQLVLGGVSYKMRRAGMDFKYVVSSLSEDNSFYFLSNGVQSKRYDISVLQPPIIQDFEVLLEYPKYLQMKSELIKGTGNVVIPEGTKVHWSVKTLHTDKVSMIARDTILGFEKSQNIFSLNLTLFNDLGYEISNSNRYLEDFERLDYSLKVIKDANPTIVVSQTVDSLQPNVYYFKGRTSDDYGVASVNMVYYALGSEDVRKTVTVDSNGANWNPFFHVFSLDEGLDPTLAYRLYFEVTDNDGIRKGKTTRSEVFTINFLSVNELTNKDLNNQNTLIKALEKTKGKFEEQEKLLEQLNLNQKEHGDLKFKQQQNIKDFLKQQELQEGMMEKFSKQLRENLSKSDTDEKLNQLLQERLERQELEAQKNQKLLEELNKVSEKLNKEELTKQLEQLGNKQKNSQRGLEQLLELTKRYYVAEKAKQLSFELDKLGKEQLELIDDGLERSKELERQLGLNKDFDEFRKQLEELRKDNAGLKKPMDLPNDEILESGIKNDQKDALEELQNAENRESSNQKQKRAGTAIQEMSEQLGGSTQSGEGEAMAEDAEALRQILDNLIYFSFKQEALVSMVRKDNSDALGVSESVKVQQELREMFQHVDDSLFSLSLRRAELSEFVNEQITEVYYNTDKALERLVEGQTYQGASYQQYVLTAANSLAEFLADVLENMQQSLMSGDGKGQGSDFQLPDIIKAQGELQDKMGQMGKDKKGKGTEGDKKESGSEGMDPNSKGGASGKALGREGKNQSGDEMRSEELYEIYKQQQILKDQLERQLDNMINNEDRKLGEKLVRQMEDFQNELIENGVTQKSMARINTIQYELLKLEDAALRQGKKLERESNTNRNVFANTLKTQDSVFKIFDIQEDILEREALPLREVYKELVKSYFRWND